jgi:hypothetical protein
VNDSGLSENALIKPVWKHTHMHRVEETCHRIDLSFHTLNNAAIFKLCFSARQFYFSWWWWIFILQWNQTWRENNVPCFSQNDASIHTQVKQALEFYLIFFPVETQYEGFLTRFYDPATHINKMWKCNAYLCYCIKTKLPNLHRYVLIIMHNS